MISEEKWAVTCEADGQSTTGFVIRRPLGRDERMIRAAKIFAIFFVIGLFTIFIPILHFILPPLFLLGGVVFATTTWLETAEILSGEVVCANCKQVIQFQREAEEWPKVQRCVGCSFIVKINPVVEPPVAGGLT